MANKIWMKNSVTAFLCFQSLSFPAWSHQIENTQNSFDPKVLKSRQIRQLANTASIRENQNQYALEILGLFRTYWKPPQADVLKLDGSCLVEAHHPHQHVVKLAHASGIKTVDQHFLTCLEKVALKFQHRHPGVKVSFNIRVGGNIIDIRLGSAVKQSKAYFFTMADRP